MDFNIAIIGLGLMGGSMALALRGFREGRIMGFARREETVASALSREMIDEGYVLDDRHARAALARADLAIVCLFPEAARDFLGRFGDCFKRGAVVTDVTGVKEGMAHWAREALPEGVDFVGGHPMAGREQSGLDAALPTLFRGCNYILIPSPWNSCSSIDLLREMALFVGAGRVILTDAAHHDRMIAYTSQMAHVLAGAIAQMPWMLESKGYEGGSFRDLTRVATLNPDMWSELFVQNKKELTEVLDALLGNLTRMRDEIAGGERAALREELSRATRRKEEWLSCKA